MWDFLTEFQQLIEKYEGTMLAYGPKHFCDAVIKNLWSIDRAVTDWLYETEKAA